MVAIANGLQSRILDAAGKHLGPAASDFIRDLCHDRLKVPFEQIEYTHVTPLLRAIEVEAGPLLGRRTADAFADELLALARDVEAGIPGRLVGSAGRVLGPAADPFMRNVCRKLGIDLDMIDRTTLPLVAEAAEADARPLFGDETAEAIRHAIERGALRPAGLVTRVIDASTRHLGRGGEEFIRAMCRARLEIELEEIAPEGLPRLAEGVRTEAAALIGHAGAQEFARAVAAALVSPNTGLRARIVDLARKFVGPAGEDFLKRSCRRAGMPWEAVDVDHLMWLAEVVRAESAPIVGKKKADEFARSVRSILTGK